MFLVGTRSDGTSTDGWLKKVDADGTEDTATWNRSFGAPDSPDQALSVAVDADGAVYVAGTRHNGTDVDWWVKKFLASGVEDTTGWDLTFDGGAGDDVARSVTVGPFGQVYVAGYEMAADGVFTTVRVRKFTSQGQVIWSRAYDLSPKGEIATDCAVVPLPPTR